MEENHKKSKKLVVAIIGIIGIVVVATFILLATLSVRRARAVIVRDVTEDVQMISKGYADAVSYWIMRGVEALDTYTESDVIYNHESSRAIGDWLTTTVSRRYENFDYVLFIDAKGNSYYDDGKTGNHSDRAYYKKIASGQAKWTIENPTVAKATKKVSVMVVKGAYDKNGELVGMFVGVHALKFLQNEIASLKLGAEGFAFLLDGNGVVISHNKPEYTLSDTVSKNFATDDEFPEDVRAVAKDMTAGNTSSGYVYKGTPNEMFVSYEPVKGTPWAIAFCVPKRQIHQSSDELRGTLIIGDLIIGLIILIVIAVMITVSLKPLSVVVNTIEGIASGNADLSQRIEVTHNNEIGQVVSGFNAFVKKIQDIIIKVKESKVNLDAVDSDLAAAVEDTESSITQILANIESVKSGITKENASVQGTATAITEIASNIQSLERMIENQASGVTQASAAIEEMIGNIGSVNTSVEKMANSFEVLQSNATSGAQKQQTVNERIEQIESQSVMLQEANAAIAAIAEQTNLLAMNAAIEAAHAGEAGKGFSVVADEIRKLSETSQTQSRTIGDQLNKIKESIGEVVTSSAESSQAFQAVSTNIETTDELVRQIRSAMQEQQEGSKQVLEALQSMSDTTQQVREASVEMSEGSQSILHEIATLKDYSDEMEINMTEMDAGAKKINETGVALHDLSTNMRNAIAGIGSQIDQFKV